MPDLDLVLRTPGTLLLMEPRRARALVDRAFEERVGRSGGWLARLLGRDRGAGSESGEGDADARRDILAQPELLWAQPGEIEEGEGYAIVGGVAVIDICGVLTEEGYYDWWEDRWTGGYRQIGRAIEAARADDRVHGLFLRVNSPGGLADGCFELAERIRAGRAAEGGKPVRAHARLACSAAYALACSADRIVAQRTAEVGSIGVVILHTDMSGMLAEWGLKIEAIQSAARKTVGAPWRPLSDDDRDHFQAIVDEIATWFVATVAAGRGLAAEAIKAQEALWFMAGHSDPKRSGLALGLIDAIGEEREAFAEFMQSLSQAKEEDTMTLAEKIAALKAKADAGDEAAKKKLAALAKLAESDGMDDDDEDEAAAEGDEEEDEDEPAAEGDEEEDDDEEEPAAKATGSAAGFALLAAPEAKGREALAQRLGRKVAARKLTYSEAKAILAAAPKGRRLDAAMAGRDMNPGADAGGDRPRAAAAADGWKKAIAKANARVRAA